MISIVVPCYNSEKYIKKTLKSLLTQQTLRDYQVVVVDDGSTDGSLGICQELEKEFPKLKVIHQDNSGLMCAWKAGVKVAEGSYIAFCDSDDYIDSSLIEKLEPIIETYNPDIITYSMVIEYSESKKTYVNMNLRHGYYDRKRIESEIHPYLYSNGSMESGLIAKSRCSKLFKKSLLNSVIPSLSNEVSFGEDDLTMLATVLNAKSIYCIEQYYPYHYMRNDESMMGIYDEKTFDKIKLLYTKLFDVASQYRYPYKNQLWQDCFETYLLYIKKEIFRNPNGNNMIMAKIEECLKEELYIEAKENSDIRGFTVKTKIFAKLLMNNRLKSLIYITKLVKLLGLG